MKLPFTKEQHNSIYPQICVLAFGILLTALIIYFDYAWAFIEEVLTLAAPFFIGFALAYLVGPLMHKFERLLNHLVFKKKKRKKLNRALSILLAFSVMFFVVGLIITYMVPQLINSIGSAIEYITSFLKNNSAELNSVLSEINKLLKSDIFSFNGDQLVVVWENIVTGYFADISALLGNIVVITASVFSFLLNLLVSIITAFYILMDKERIAAQIKKIGYAFMPRDKIEEVIFWTRRANRIFKGFLIGKVIDSAIIGTICYFCMLMFKIEYALLISIVIGITNIIPFFGPFIGWAPCALLLLMVNPVSALWFSLFILLLQQLDGNVIGPFILGDYVGVSALSIMIAIVIGGGLFGFVGMLISVPVYALGYAIFRSILHVRLTNRNLPTKTEDYIYAPQKLKKIKEENA